MKVEVWIWKHLIFKSLILFGVYSATGFRSLICPLSNLCVFFHQHRIIFSTRKNYNLFSQSNYQKYQWRSSRCWNYYYAVKSIVSSKLPGVFLNENTRMNLDQFLKWFWKCKAAFATIYLLLSAGLTVGVSTAICEASFSSVVRILTLYRRCMTYDRTGA